MMYFTRAKTLMVLGVCLLGARRLLLQPVCRLRCGSLRVCLLGTGSSLPAPVSFSQHALLTGVWLHLKPNSSPSAPISPRRRLLLPSGVLRPRRNPGQAAQAL